jgi:predicted transcriptional regulator
MTNTNPISSSSGKRRSRTKTEIVIQILDAVNDCGEDGNGNDGVTKTTLMYKVFLNSDQLGEYLAALTAHNLLYYDRAMHTYSSTRKGLLFVDFWCNMRKMIDESRRHQQLRQIG